MCASLFYDGVNLPVIKKKRLFIHTLQNHRVICHLFSLESSIRTKRTFLRDDNQRRIYGSSELIQFKQEILVIVLI